MSRLIDCLRSGPELQDYDVTRLSVAETPDQARKIAEGLLSEAQSYRAALGREIEAAGGALPETTVAKSAPVAPKRAPAKRAGGDARVKAARNGVIDRRAPSKAGPVKPRRPDQIIQELSEAFEVPIRYKRFNFPGAMGVYKPGVRVIRRKAWNDVEVVAHEVGHFLEERYGPALRDLMKEHSGELTPLASPGMDKLGEGFAEYMRLRLSQPERAPIEAPGFHAALDNLLGENPKDAEALARAARDIDDWFSADPKARMRTLIGARPRPLGERVRGLGGRLVFNALDEFNPIKRWRAKLAEGKALPASEDPYKLARLSRGSDGQIDHFLFRGTLPFDFDARAKGPVGKSLAEILDPIDTRVADFELYAVARRARELHKQKRERLFSPADVDAVFSQLDSPEFRRAFNELQAFQDDVLQYARDGGILSPELYKQIKPLNKNFVPFKRVIEGAEIGGKGGGQGLGNVGAGVHQLRGGSQNIHPPLQSILDNTVMLISATNRNHAAAAMARLAMNSQGGGAAMERLPKVPQALRVATNEIAESLKKAGMSDIPPDVIEALGEWQTFWRAKPLAESKNHQLIVRLDGEPVAFEVDPLLYESLTSISPPAMNAVENILAGFGRTLRAGVVFDPTYMARNMSRDQLTAFIQSEHGFVPVVDGLRGAYARAVKDDDFWQFMAFGGGQSSFWAANDKAANRFLGDVLTKRGQRPLESSALDWYLVDSARKAGSWIEALGEITESGSRIGEFKKAGGGSPYSGGNELLDGALAGRDVSTDFAMHGASRSLRFLTRITPFLNAGIQGLYKGARAASEGGFRKAFVPVAMKAVTGLALPSLALYLWTRDEGWYKDLPPSEKNMYWHLPPPAEGGEPIRVAKPFEWGFLAGTAPVMAVEAWHSDLVARQGQKFADAALQVFGLRVIPPSLQVPLELTANYNYFTGRPIVPPYIKPGPYDYSAWTSETVKVVALKTGVSARKLEHAVRGIFGSLGMLTLQGTDVLLRALDPSIPSLPSRRLSDFPGLKAFVSRYPQGFSGPTAELYELNNDIAQRLAAYRKLKKEGREDAAETIKQEMQELGDADLKQLVKRGIGAQRKARKAIESIKLDRGKTPAEKRAEIDQLLIDANRVSREQRDKALRFMADRKGR